jgi:hypothetical protein
MAGPRTVLMCSTTVTLHELSSMGYYPCAKFGERLSIHSIDPNINMDEVLTLTVLARTTVSLDLPEVGLTNTSLRPQGPSLASFSWIHIGVYLGRLSLMRMRVLPRASRSDYLISLSIRFV